jgi:hypothetical protein
VVWSLVVASALGYFLMALQIFGILRGPSWLPWTILVTEILIVWVVAATTEFGRFRSTLLGGIALGVLLLLATGFLAFGVLWAIALREAGGAFRESLAQQADYIKAACVFFGLFGAHAGSLYAFTWYKPKQPAKSARK